MRCGSVGFLCSSVVFVNLCFAGSAAGVAAFSTMPDVHDVVDKFIALSPGTFSFLSAVL